MAGPAGDDSRVSVRRALRTARWPGPAAPVLLTVLLAGTLLAGCGSGGPAVGGATAGGEGGGCPPRATAGSTAAGSATAGSATAGSATAGQAGPGRGSSPGPGSASASPGDTVPGVSNSVANRPVTDAGPAVAPGRSGSGPGCSRWPAGSGGATLLVTQASNGQQYCVHPGQAVQVYLGGMLSPAAGSEPPRLTGTGLAPSPSGQAHLLRSPAAAYQAVRAGRSVLTIVRQPCHSVAPAQTPAAGPQGAEGVGPGDTSGPQGAEGVGPGDTSGAVASANAVELAYTGGAPVGAQCALEQALRVTIIVS
jgi:hypothetical protein